MPSTEALVGVRIVKIDQIDWARLNGGPLQNGDRPYLIATISYAGDRFFGRTQTFPWDGSKSGIIMPVDATDGAWGQAFLMTAGNPIHIAVEARVDRGDAPPKLLASTSDDIIYSENDLSDTLEEEVTSSHASGIQVHYKTKIQAIPPERALPNLARSMPSENVENHLDFPYTAVTRITHVKGLYKPVLMGSKATSVAEEGYISSDDKGRIFVNQDHLGQALDGDQWIQVRAEATFINADVALGNMTIKWAIITHHDDPSDDHPFVHRDAGRVLDPKDYDAHGVHIGPQGHDNEGTYTDPLFVACEGFGIVTLDKAKRTAVTAVKYRGYGTAVPVYSEVRIKCSNVAGDRFSVEAVLVVEDYGDEEDNPDVLPASTGIMTMWKRIPVRVFKMKSAFALDTAPIAQEYTACMVQLDFGEPEEVEDVRELSTYPGGADQYLLKIAGPPLYPPTFVLLLALHHALIEKKAEMLERNHQTKIIRGSINQSIPCEVVSVPGDMSETAKRVSINWMENEQPRKAIFSVQIGVFKPEKNVTLLYLLGHDVTRDFTGADSDGSSLHAHKTRFHVFVRGAVKNDQWVGSGYGGPEDVSINVQAAGGMPVSGLSPTRSVNGQAHFAGRTIVFTHHGAYNANFGKADPPAPRDTFASDASSTLVHEFCHAFGMPHKCADWDYKTPREKSCCMNYSNTWVMDQANAFIASSIDKVGPSLCGRHLKEVRRVLLHKNPVYSRG